jgi:hypothetical protein
MDRICNYNSFTIKGSWNNLNGIKDNILISKLYSNSLYWT